MDGQDDVCMGEETDQVNDGDELFGKNDEKAQVPAEEVLGEDPFRCEECGPRRVLPDPGRPTQSELEDHRIDHVPYRSWCGYI